MRCTSRSDAPVYSDTERNLMDSYGYENLLPGNGTGLDPLPDAHWNDFSFDGNDVIDIRVPTYVSCVYIITGTLCCP